MAVGFVSDPELEMFAMIAAMMLDDELEAA